MVDEQDKTKATRNRRFLVKDFDGYKAALTQYARTFFSPEKVNDFSEPGIPGMIIDLTSYVGDNLSFYLDHQFGELDPETAVEPANIERHVRSAGVPIRGAAPAVVDVTLAVEIDAARVGSEYVPQTSQLPIILAGTIFESTGGIRFELQEDVDFTTRDENGELVATITVSSTVNGLPSKFILTSTGVALSGFRTSETFTFGQQLVPFRTITLANENVTEIISVRDSDGDEYYEVSSLTQNTVFKRVSNVGRDRDEVPDNLEVILAPRRFTVDVNIATRATSLRFGSGRAVSNDIDNVPDPATLALPLYGKRTFSRMTLDPNSLLQTNTLGVAPIDTTLTVDYRYGGGLSHNIEPDTLRTISQLLVRFPSSPTPAEAARVRASIAVTNRKRASGGDAAPTMQELRQLIPAYRNAQSRVVTGSDLLARVYTLPANFGRVFRAGIRAHPNNPLTTLLYIVCRDSAGRLIPAPDSLKLNLRQLLNQYRMISDSIDILDVPIVNIGLEYQIITAPTANRSLVVQTVNQRLAKFLSTRERQVDQPISLSDVRNIIFNNPGIVSVIDVKIRNNVGTVGGKAYSDIQFAITANTVKDHIFPPAGGIFEVRYPKVDIVGSAV